LFFFWFFFLFFFFLFFFFFGFFGLFSFLVFLGGCVSVFLFCGWFWFFLVFLFLFSVSFFCLFICSVWFFVVGFFGGFFFFPDIYLFIDRFFFTASAGLVSGALTLLWGRFAPGFPKNPILTHLLYFSRERKGPAGFFFFFFYRVLLAVPVREWRDRAQPVVPFWPMTFVIQSSQRNSPPLFPSSHIPVPTSLFPFTWESSGPLVTQGQKRFPKNKLHKLERVCSGALLPNLGFSVPPCRQR